MASDASSPSSIVRVLRRFFERRLSEYGGEVLPPPYSLVSTAHLAQFLVERTLAEASLNDGALGSLTSEPVPALRLRIAALTALRSVGL